MVLISYEIDTDAQGDVAVSLLLNWCAWRRMWSWRSSTRLRLKGDYQVLTRSIAPADRRSCEAL